MSALARRIRDLAEEYSAEFGQPIDAMIRDAMLGMLALLVIAIDVTLLLAAGGGQ